MKKSALNSESVYLHNSKYIRISPREEKNIKSLLQSFGNLQNVPSSELVTACYTNKTKNEFTDAEDYFFFPVHELTPFDESLTENRRRTFLSFKSKPSAVESKK